MDNKLNSIDVYNHLYHYEVYGIFTNSKVDLAKSFSISFQYLNLLKLNATQ